MLRLELGELRQHARHPRGLRALRARDVALVGVDLLEEVLVVGVQRQRELVVDAGDVGVRDDHVLVLRLGEDELEVDAVAALQRHLVEDLALRLVEGVVVAEPLADDEADGRVVGLLLQPLLLAHVGVDVVHLEEEEAAGATLVRRDLELRVARPRARLRAVGGDGAAAVVVARHRVVGRPAVHQAGLLPVVLRLDLLEPKVGDAVVVAVVGEDRELEERLAPRLEDERHQHVRRLRRLLERVLHRDLPRELGVCRGRGRRGEEEAWAVRWRSAVSETRPVVPVWKR